VLPLPEITPGFCSRGGAGVQLRPLQFVQDIRAGLGGGGARELLRNTALLQVSFNALLFVPLGMLARHLFRRGVHRDGVGPRGVDHLRVHPVDR